MIRAVTCPICKKIVPTPTEGNPHWFPFCSERCRQVDLLRWSQGKYQIVEPLTPERLVEELESPEDIDD